jgi:hypothetical protein
MKKTRKRSTKLRLSRETIQSLQHTTLGRAVGGFSDMAGGTSCDPDCNIYSIDPQLC